MKRIMTLLLVALLSFSLIVLFVACNDDGISKGDPKPNKNQSESKKETTAISEKNTTSTTKPDETTKAVGSDTTNNSDTTTGDNSQTTTAPPPTTTKPGLPYEPSNPKGDGMGKPIPV